MTAVATGRSLGARLVLLTGAAVVLLIVALSLWVDRALAAAYRDQFDDALRFERHEFVQDDQLVALDAWLRRGRPAERQAFGHVRPPPA